MQFFGGSGVQSLHGPARKRTELLRKLLLKQVHSAFQHPLLQAFAAALPFGLFELLLEHRTQDLILHHIDHANLLQPLVYGLFNSQYAR